MRAILSRSQWRRRGWWLLAQNGGLIAIFAFCGLRGVPAFFGGVFWAVAVAATAFVGGMVTGALILDRERPF